MGKHLGLNDDYYHLIIPFVVYLLFIPFIMLFFKERLFALHLIADLVLMISLIQFFYEWLQATDPYVHLKYGDWIGFQINTKKDIKFFVVGSFVGIFVGFLVYVILANYVFISDTVQQIQHWKLLEPSTLPPERL